LRVNVTAELIEELRHRTKAERKEIGDAINSVLEAWGKPHLHAGIGIRRLTTTIYECRVGREQRLVFVWMVTDAELVFFFIGTHDEVRKLIKSFR
jgi:hypothetical protein